MSVYKEAVAKFGLGPSHLMILDRVPPSSRVLDVGCATGYLAEELKSRRGCAFIDGIEFDPAAAEEAKSSCRRVFVGSAEEPSTFSSLEGPYDVVIFSDILEHLRDPGVPLAAIRTLLAPGGIALISIPNIAHYSIRWGLLRGRFDYQDTGILDRTHLRFYTRRSLLAFLERQNYAVRECAPVLYYPRVFQRWTKAVAKSLLKRHHDELFAFQFIIRAQPNAKASNAD